MVQGAYGTAKSVPRCIEVVKISQNFEIPLKNYKILKKHGKGVPGASFELNLLLTITSTDQLGFGSRHRLNRRHEPSSGEDIIIHEYHITTSTLERVLIISPACICVRVNFKKCQTFLKSFCNTPSQFQMLDSGKISENLLEHFVLSIGSFAQGTRTLIHYVEISGLVFITIYMSSPTNMQ